MGEAAAELTLSSSFRVGCVSPALTQQPPQERVVLACAWTSHVALEFLDSRAQSGVQMRRPQEGMWVGFAGFW